MKIFTDTAGRDWSLSLTITSVRKLRAVCDIDLAADDLGEVLQSLGNDPVQLCDCLYTLCEDQIEKAGLSPEAFGEGLSGDAIDAATDALLDELIEFTPKKKRAMLRKVLSKINAATLTAIDRAMTYLDSKEFDDEIDAALKFGNTSTVSPVLSDATQET